MSRAPVSAEAEVTIVQEPGYLPPEPTIVLQSGTGVPVRSIDGRASAPETAGADFVERIDDPRNSSPRAPRAPRTIVRLGAQP